MAAIHFFIWAAFVWSCMNTALVFGDRSDVCPSSCECLGNHVDCSRLGLIKVPKDLPKWVTDLEIQSNGISSLHPDDFKGLINLQNIDLSNNEISFINESIFLNLPALRQIKVNNNKLTEIPIFKQNPLLDKLELTHNKIHTINASALQHLLQLDTLDLSYNDIRDITNTSFPANLSLTKLFLRNNEIFFFEAGCFYNLTKLQALKLSKNKISHLPKDIFVKLHHLSMLDLSKNKLSKLQGLTFQGLSSLQRLKLQRNDMKILEDGVFFGLNNLQHLHLDENNLTSISHNWVYGLTKLKELTVSFNKIVEIEYKAWEYVKDIETLDLSHNEMVSIPSDALLNLAALRKLVLANNHIDLIQEGAFKDLTRLDTLDLNNNLISSTIEDVKGAFTGLASLRLLSLENNKIKTLTKQAFMGLDNLEQLLLNSNNITQIQGNAFEPLPQLKQLNFNSSSLFCDCQLSWVPIWLRDNNFEHSVIAKCSHPLALKGRSIFTVDSSDYKCDGQFLKPVIVLNPRSQDVLKGDNITLNCSAASTESQGKPTEFKWKKDGNELADVSMENFAQRQGNLTRYVSKLHVSEAEDDHAGRYQCIISNEYGSAYSKRANINVYVFPTFTKRPQNVTIKAGSEARLVCAASGQPKPTISWQKDGGFDHFPAAQERRMHVIPEDDHFYIVDVKAADEGNYSCIAKNDAGTIVANVTLSVLQTPSFVRPMKAKETRERETVVLECLSQGSPRPTLTWYHNGQPLVPSRRHFFTAEHQLLLIVETETRDAGEYTCEMSNTLGTIRGMSTLTVVTGSLPADRSVGGNSGSGGGLDDESTTTGIIIIAVVCCVVGTSLVWVIIIYQTRKRQELYSATPTDETTLPGEVPSSGYMSSDKEGSYTHGVPVTNIAGYQYHDLQMKESGYESSSGRYRAARPAIFPSDVNREQIHEGYDVVTADGGHYVQQSDENSLSSQEYPCSDTDSLKSDDDNSVNSSSHSSGGRQILSTFHPHAAAVSMEHIARSRSCSASHLPRDDITDTDPTVQQCISPITNPDNSITSSSSQTDSRQGCVPLVDSTNEEQVNASVNNTNSVCRTCGERLTSRGPHTCKHNRAPVIPPKPARLRHGRHRQLTHYDRAQPPGISRSSNDIQDYMYEADIPPPPPPPLLPCSGMFVTPDCDESGIYLTNGGLASNGAFVPVYHHAVNTPTCDCHLRYSPHAPHTHKQARTMSNSDSVPNNKSPHNQRVNAVIGCVHHMNGVTAPSWQGHALTLPYMPTHHIHQLRQSPTKVSRQGQSATRHKDSTQKPRQHTSPKTDPTLS